MLTLTAVGAAASAPVLADPPAMGLIVRLKGAPSHESVPLDDSPRASASARRESSRWQAVLRGAALSGSSGQREPTQRAVGRDQRLLDFGRQLSADEAARLAQRLRQRPEVDWVAPNVREQALQVSDPLFAQQWWLKPAGGLNSSPLGDRLRGVPGFLSAWQSGIPGGQGTTAAVVAVLDTGVTAHPDLTGRTLPGYDFVSDAVYANDGNGRDADPTDPGDWVSATDKASDTHFAGCDETRSSWHGTIIAGIVAAAGDNGLGVAGIVPQGRVLPVRVAGKCGAAVADIVDGMRWAAGLTVAGVPFVNPNPARIVNVSFGGTAACGPEYQTVITELRSQGANGRGTVVVAAAGNGHGAVSRPASCVGAVGVAALNRDGFKAYYSNFGAELAASGLATVGGDDNRGGAWRNLADSGIVSVWNTGTQGPDQPDYAALFGTSFAAPIVSGTLSLMLSVNPKLSVDQLVAGLLKSARPHVVSPMIGNCSPDNPGRCICTTASCGAGILDATQALLYAANPDTYVAPVRQAEVIDNAEVAQAVALGSDLPANTAVVTVQGSSGGGAVSAAWMLGLALAVMALRRRR